MTDPRGYFTETWSRRDMSKAGIDVDFMQDNESWSRQAGTLRGLHFQAPPHAQDKLVRCTRGKIFDVAVDIRRGSPHYGQWHGVELSPETGTQLFIPKGFLHGFLTLEDDTEVQYKCSDTYAPECDGAVRWDSLGIAWPLNGAPILSQKDADAVPFSAFQSPFVWNNHS
jgi:dTDP-4-dehydrorhamnose 3,5-epimerase